MSKHTLTLQKIEPVTHNVNHLVFDKPEGFSFTPGQATDFSLDREGWRDEERPFTFTSFPDDDTLEFTIKSYFDHDGVTKQIAGLKPGDTVLIGDAWGAIEDKGPGTFIAGGAGLTPFIPILRNRARNGTIDGCTLIYANKTAGDIIHRAEWEAMEGLKTVWIVDEEDPDIAHHGHIDTAFLNGKVQGGHVYVCGPPKMIDVAVDAVRTLGWTDDNIVTEEA